MWAETERERDDNVIRRLCKPDHSLLWGYPVYYGMLPIILGLHPLAASSFHLSCDNQKLSLDTAKCPLRAGGGEESSATENHRPSKIKNREKLLIC